MTNITMAIDEKLLVKARALAARKGTTLNALVREQLASAISAEDRREEARLRLVKLMETSTARLPKGYKFNREELYESPSLSRHKRPGLRSSRKTQRSG